MSAEENDLRQKAVVFLMNAFEKPKQPDEFTIYDICEIMKVDKRTAHSRMAYFVKQGTWETRLAYVDEYGRKLRLWKLKDSVTE